MTSGTDHAAANMLHLDGAPHRALRAAVAAAFEPSRVAARAEPFADRLRAAADAFVEQGGGPFLADVVHAAVVEDLVAVLGLDSWRATLDDTLPGTFGALEPDSQDAVRAVRRLGLGPARAVVLGDVSGGLLGSLVSAAQAGKVSLAQAATTPSVVLHGGYEQPMLLAGWATFWALDHHVELVAAAASGRLGALTDDLIRWASPVRRVERWDGERVVVVDLRAANRHRDVFACPDEVSATSAARHVSFGHGPHSCPGAALARQQLSALLATLAHMPLSSVAGCEIEWLDGIFTHGPCEVTFTWGR